MENKCLVCERTRSLKVLDDHELRICERINEIFNIKLNEYVTPKSMICKRCVTNLNTSYEFYQQIKNTRDRLKSFSTAIIKVEVKEEISESYNAEEDFSIFPPFDSPFSRKENDESEKETIENKVSGVKNFKAKN